VDGLAAALAAFEALRAASRIDPDLFVGRAALPRSEAEARRRALRIVQVLSEVGRPDRLVQVVVTLQGDASPRWHVAPLYAMRIGTGARIEGVADPFLRRAPLSFDEWRQQLKVEDAVFLFPEQLLAEHEAMMHAPATLRDGRSDITTQKGGHGTADDAHGLAQLLRAWLKAPDDITQVERFRAMFGEQAWRALENAYPKLVSDIQAELAKRAKVPVT
jgi:hypothetical protein